MSKNAIVIVSAQTDHECYGSDCYCEPHVNTEVLDDSKESQQAILNNVDHHLLRSLLIELLSNKDKRFYISDKELKDHGLMRIKNMPKDIQATLEQTYLLYKNRHYGNIVHDCIDIESMSDYDIELLAQDGNKVLQLVNKASFVKTLPDHLQRKYKTVMKKNKERAEKRRATKAKREASKQAKKLEAAKKLLQEAGEI